VQNQIDQDNSSNHSHDLGKFERLDIKGLSDLIATFKKELRGRMDLEVFVHCDLGN